MMLNIGHIAKTYGVLPSLVRECATTYDLMIADVMSSWEQYQLDKATGKASQHYDVETLQTMMNKVKK